MNIFFKFLAVVGIGGTIGGATYLAKQEYTNNSSLTTKQVPKRQNGDTVDIKRQPTFGSPEATKAEGSAQASSSSGSTTATTTEASTQQAQTEQVTK